MPKTKAHASASATAAARSLPLPFAASFFQTDIDGITTLTAFIAGEPRIALRDVNRLLGYEHNRDIEGLRGACAAIGKDLDAHTSQLAPNIGRRGRQPFLDIEGVRCICEALSVGSADRLRHWLAQAITAPRVSEPKRDRKSEYAIRLCTVLVEHLTTEEVVILGGQLEAFTATVLSARYSRELNAATYNLYAEFHLRGAPGRRMSVREIA